MKTIEFASNVTNEIAELPCPDATSIVTSEASSDGNSRRSLPSVTDSGRISFGAAMRLPVQK